jgi:hypothetical protein
VRRRLFSQRGFYWERDEWSKCHVSSERTGFDMRIRAFSRWRRGIASKLQLSIVAFAKDAHIPSKSCETPSIVRPIHARWYNERTADREDVAPETLTNRTQSIQSVVAVCAHGFELLGRRLEIMTACKSDS